MCIYIVLRQAGARNHGEFILVRHEEGLMRSAIYKQGCVSGASVIPSVSGSRGPGRGRATTGLAGRDDVRRARARDRVGSCFSHRRARVCMRPGRGAVVCFYQARRGDRRPPGPCRLAYGGGTPGRGAALLPPPPSGRLRPGVPALEKVSLHPSVDGQSVRQEEGHSIARICMHTTHRPATRKTIIQKPQTHHSLVSPSCPSLHLLSLSLSLSLSHHILLYCPPLSWKPTQVNPSLARPPVACLV